MNKEQLMDELRYHTYVMLRPSPVHGVGVFAVRDIPQGQRGIFSNDKSEWLKIPRAEINGLPGHSRLIVENYCLFDDEYYYVPEYGFKMVDLAVCLNHDNNPNIISINEGEDFEALRDIRAGEELLIDYGEIV